MRELLENALYAPTSGRFKVYIIDEVHMLSRSAFNAMLKTLEEPPGACEIHSRDDRSAEGSGNGAVALPPVQPQADPSTRDPRAPAVHPRGRRHRHRAGGAELDRARGARQPARRAEPARSGHRARGRAGWRSPRCAPCWERWISPTFFLFCRRWSQRDGARMLAIADEMQARSFDFESALQDLATLLHRIALLQTLPSAAVADDLDREQVAGTRGRSHS